MRDITNRLEEQKLLPAETPATNADATLKQFKRRIEAALELHHHVPDGNWIICDGDEYLASNGCKTARVLKGLKSD